VSDRLTLTRALDGSGMESAAAERIATEIYDAIHDNVATKADLREPVMAGSAVDAMLRHFQFDRGHCLPAHRPGGEQSYPHPGNVGVGT
jgi:hypothetical protein